MQAYYKHSVRCGIYVEPRACKDNWKCHWVGESFPLYDRLIQDMIAFLNADPNRSERGHDCLQSSCEAPHGRSGWIEEMPVTLEGDAESSY